MLSSFAMDVHITESSAPGELWAAGGSIEERWRGVSEPLPRQQLIGLNGSINVLLVDANRHSHQHVLRPLHHLAVDLQEDVHLGPHLDFLDHGEEVESVALRQGEGRSGGCGGRRAGFARECLGGELRANLSYGPILAQG
ncbi:hypothetical protein E2C01_027898 [Portunus trituberculatus]|uniref:Uncharacterized protein n=1 Tax=Portunus trituberculatus TaxID=210409 RepID=A0A5B7EMS9_PORTR|nr:hypothetical protein [Portunus trituberculatus]